MFNLFKRRRKYQDLTETVKAMSIFLVDDTGADVPTPLKEHLNTRKLDYSLESLKCVDAYLDVVRKNRKALTEDQIVKVVLRCGTYCGEVIRRLSKKDLYWINYDTAIGINAQIMSFGKSPDTFYILFAEPNDFSFPLAKVVKYLDNGPEDSLYFLAVALLSQSSEKKR